MADATVVIRVDPTSYALIERCAHALADNGLPYLIDEMCQAGSFNEAIQMSRQDDVLTVSLGMMTELVLRECIDVAERKDWPAAMKAQWLRQMMEVAGVRQDQRE